MHRNEPSPARHGGAQGDRTIGERREASSAAKRSPDARAEPSIRPRAPRLAFDGVRRHWLAGSRAATQVANGVNLLFPAGERFFIRSVRHYLDRVSPELAADVKGFFGQEGRHAQAHERLFDTLRAQGFDIDSLLERYEHIAYDYIEKAAPPPLRLAVTVALEHFTAILAEDALSADVLAHADPEIRRLLEWHAVEELEHKAVAFDVLKEVAPSYALRVLGMVVATMTLGGFWIWATRALLEQDGSSFAEARRELEALRELAAREGETRVMDPVGRRVFLRGIREYLRPGFHPMDRDHSALIAATLARLEEEGVVVGAQSADVPS
ncbi:MAG: metal-dependent hydrolase [Labilithrix sp.]|nr:metal-dependent hydrolase [Labilithrix sp.]MBX3224770.1 metal-dependent hydrolase [Labilithrix sp.]